jgi:hypothetical protein
MYGKPDRAEDCGAMDSVCCGSGNSHLASHLDVKIVWHQRSINQVFARLPSGRKCRASTCNRRLSKLSSLATQLYESC